MQSIVYIQCFNNFSSDFTCDLRADRISPTALPSPIRSWAPAVSSISEPASRRARTGLGAAAEQTP
jgi:hypothetical protein